MRERVAAVKRWFDNDWQKLDNKIKSSIVEGVSVFLAMFDMPDVAAVFCPPAPEVSDDPRRIGPKARAAMLAEKKDKAKAEGQGKDSAEKKGKESRQWPARYYCFERPRYLPPLYELIEQRQGAGFEYASREQPGAGPRHRRDAQKRMASSPAHAARPDEGIPNGTYFRPAVFICDEYQAFASVGEDDPTGDEKSFALNAAMPVHPDCCNPIHILIAGRAWQFRGVAGAACRRFAPGSFYP